MFSLLYFFSTRYLLELRVYTAGAALQTANLENNKDNETERPLASEEDIDSAEPTSSSQGIPLEL